MFEAKRSWHALNANVLPKEITAAPTLTMNDDVAAGEAAACGIDANDSDRKGIGTVVHIDGENAHPTANPHCSGKMRMITIRSETRHLSVSKADPTRRVIKRAEANDLSGKSARVFDMEVE